jgi:hypothetical protein
MVLALRVDAAWKAVLSFHLTMSRLRYSEVAMGVEV